MNVGLTSLQLKVWHDDFSCAIYVPPYLECSFGSLVASSINSVLLGTCFSYTIKDAV